MSDPKHVDSSHDVPALPCRTGDEDPPNEKHCTEGRDLLDASDRAVAEALKAVSSPPSRVRRLFAQALGESRQARYVPGLLGLLRDSDKTVRAAAAESLGRIGDPVAVPRLLRALSDVSWDVRAAAATALAQIGDVRAVGPLLVCAAWPREAAEARTAAARALVCLGDADVLPVRIVADARIPVPDRIQLLDQLRGFEHRSYGLTIRYAVPDTATFCRKCLDHADDAVRRGAREMLEHGTLLRPSDGDGGAALLRPVDSADRASLLRPIHEPQQEDEP